MTVQNLIVKNIASGNGSTTQWPFTFACPVDHPEYIKVYIKDENGNVSLTNDYNVDMQTKKVIYPVNGPVLQSGQKIVIARELPLYQLLNLVNQGPFFAENLEGTYDELVMMIQQLNEKLERTMSFSIDVDQDAFNPNVPIAAGKTFRINNAGTGFEVTEDPAKVLPLATAEKNAAAAGALSAQNAASVAQGIASRFTNLDTAVTQCQANATTAITKASEASASATSANTSATTASTKASEASVSASAAANSASSAGASYASAIQALRDATLINNSGNADTLSTTNAADIIEINKFMPNHKSVTLRWNYGYVDGSNGNPHPTSYTNTNRYTDLTFIPKGYKLNKEYAKNLYVYMYNASGTFVKLLSALTSTGNYYNFMNDCYCRFSLELLSSDATESFNPADYISVTTNTDVEKILNILSGDKVVVPQAYENGYLDGSTGEEKNNSVNARTTTILHLKKGAKLYYSGIDEAILHIYDNNGNWQGLYWLVNFLNTYGNPINQDLNVRIVVRVGNTMSNAILSKLNCNDSTCSVYFEDYEHSSFTDKCNTSVSQWYGKKIVWFGTSIPAGVINAGDTSGSGSYPNRIGEMLGATVYNEAQGSSGVRAGNFEYITPTDTMGFGGLYATSLLYSLSLSSAEKQQIINEWDSKWKNIVKQPEDVNVTGDVSNYLNSSWDIKLAKYLSGGSVGQCDLYVFDHGYNDAGYGYNWHNCITQPSDETDRTYFIGAMNFLIHKILSDNARAKILIIGHYTDKSGSGTAKDGTVYQSIIQYCCQAQELVAKSWNIPIIKTWEHIGFGNHMISTTGYWDSNGKWVSSGGALQTISQKNVWLRDGIHPSSDTSGKALEHYANILAPLLKTIG